MAIYSSTGMVKAQIMVNQAFEQDKRFNTPEVWLLFMRSNPQFFDQYASLRIRDDKADEANYFKRTSRALGSSKTHNHTGTVGDTGVITLDWGIYSDVFAKTLMQADGKIISAEDIMNNELVNTFINFIEQLEDESSSYLVDNRSGVNVAAINGTFDATNDVYEISATNYLTSGIQITKAVMYANKYGKGMPMTIVCDPVAFVEFERQANQGTGNSANTSFQFSNVRFIMDVGLTAKAAAIDVTYTKGFWIVVAEGTIGAATFIEPKYKQGVSTTVNTYGSIQNPIDGLLYGVHSYETRADGTSKGGTTQDVVTEVQIYQEVAFSKAPLSVAGETTIQAFTFV